MKVLLFLTLSFFSITSFADVYVEPYQKQDGSRVEGHYRTEPNSTRNDNYSTEGNYNPHTGNWGTKARDN